MHQLLSLVKSFLLINGKFFSLLHGKMLKLSNTLLLRTMTAPRGFKYSFTSQ